MNMFELLLTKASWTNEQLHAAGVTHLDLHKPNTPNMEVMFDAAYMYGEVNLIFLKKLVDLPKINMSVRDMQQHMRKLWKSFQFKDKYHYDLLISLNNALGHRSSIGCAQWKTIVYRTILEVIPVE